MPTPFSFLHILFLILFVSFPHTIIADEETGKSPQIPQPFDTTLIYKLTSPCFSFFKTFLSDEYFRDCNSFGFLLSSSNEFALISRNISNNPEQITILLDTICSPKRSIEQCLNTMNVLSDKMTLPENCRKDLQDQNPIANQAQISFKTYKVMQEVGCSKNSTDTYCYVDTLLTKVGLGMFYLPSGTSLPSQKGEGWPCSECNKKILNIYANYTEDKSLPLSKTFGPAREQLSSKCGPDFVKSPGNSIKSRIWNIEYISVAICLLLL